MIVYNQGRRQAHHFAHKSKNRCDPWYSGNKSAWHIKMQSFFPVDCQEAVIWDNYHSEYHIADVAFSFKGQKYVFEFQHSKITHKAFLERTAYYMNLGYKIIWFFDFRDSNSPKKILYSEKDTTKGIAQFIWMKDRIRILDRIDNDLYKCVDDEYNTPENLSIIFHVLSGRGEEVEHSDGDGFYWETWEYIDPFNREYLFLEPICFWKGLERFDAYYYEEEDFYTALTRYAKEAKPITASI